MTQLRLFRIRFQTVPMETPQSMLEEPSSGSKTTQYLCHQSKFKRIHVKKRGDYRNPTIKHNIKELNTTEHTFHA